MLEEKPPIDISLNNIRINSIVSNSGVFAGRNIQYLWRSDRTTQSGFGTVIGEGNTLESPYNVVTDPGSSSELVEYLEELVSTRIVKRGL
ncbi:MAG: hypothetical protein ACYCYE_00150 [Clostridia bacterium]